MCLADFMATVYDEKLNKNSNADTNFKWFMVEKFFFLKKKVKLNRKKHQL